MSQPINLFRSILLKLASTLIFAGMQALIRISAHKFPLGEVVFFRGWAAIIPVLVVYAWRRELSGALRMAQPLGHVTRGTISAAAMYLNFASLALLPLIDAVAIGFTAPLITVALAVIFLKEDVRFYRWAAVGVGFIGVMVMLIPHIDVAQVGHGALSAVGAVGAICGLLGAFGNAGTVIQTRRMTFTESTSAIVFYFSLFAALGGLVTLPFGGWLWPDSLDLVALVMMGVLGGLGHILLTESYRYAPASVSAPFDYASMIWALLIGFFIFGEIPHVLVLLGAVIVAGAGLFVIWRERQLGLQPSRNEAPPALP